MDDSLCVTSVKPWQGKTSLSPITCSTDTDGSEAHSLFKNVALILL